MHFEKTNLKFPSICNHFTDNMETAEEGIKTMKSLKVLSLDVRTSSAGSLQLLNVKYYC